MKIKIPPGPGRLNHVSLTYQQNNPIKMSLPSGANFWTEKSFSQSDWLVRSAWMLNYITKDRLFHPFICGFQNTIKEQSSSQTENQSNCWVTQVQTVLINFYSCWHDSFTNTTHTKFKFVELCRVARRILKALLVWDIRLYRTHCRQNPSRPTSR